jgi:hypothetical protein
VDERFDFFRKEIELLANQYNGLGNPGMIHVRDNHFQILKFHRYILQ